jgi:Enoyl-CoA hydratase/carnithine racemase
MTARQHVSLEVHGAVRLVTLSRPERRNALGTQTMAELAEVIGTARNEGFGCVVLTGAPPAFCAGSDLKELAGLSPAEMAEHERQTGAVAASIARADIPVIAAVEGYTLGGGMILAASCDVVVTAADAKWSLPEVRNGWLPPWGLGALVARVGPIRALGLTWGAADCNGSEAHRIGLADHLCAPGEALATALALAERLAALPAHAVMSAKQFYQHYRESSAHELQSAAQFQRDAGHPAAQAVLSRFASKS